jgi:hypothetical protein
MGLYLALTAHCCINIISVQTISNLMRSLIICYYQLHRTFFSQFFVKLFFWRKFISISSPLSNESLKVFFISGIKYVHGLNLILRISTYILTTIGTCRSCAVISEKTVTRKITHYTHSENVQHVIQFFACSVFYVLLKEYGYEWHCRSRILVWVLYRANAL